MENQVAILMTTYNSAQYIGEQIDSLLNQTFQSWRLYVRDDCSTDNTIDKINAYVLQDARICLLRDEVKRGAKSGFLWLLEQVEAPYYMFCDHDDVWLPHKIEKLMGLMHQHEHKYAGSPIIVHADMQVVDERLQLLAPSFWAFQHYKPSDSFNINFHLAYNNVAGCAMLFNQEAKCVSLPCHPDVWMHDGWIAVSVLSHHGFIVDCQEQLVLYRQHGDNAVGARKLPGLREKIKNFKKSLRASCAQGRVAHSLVGMSTTKFFVIKTYYMIVIHWRHWVH